MVELMEAGPPHRVSLSGGTRPLWSRDGKELYYRTMDGGALMVVPIENEPRFSRRDPERPIETPNLEIWDVDLERNRFLAVRLPDAPPITKLNVIFNLTEELARLVPTDGDN